MFICLSILFLTVPAFAVSLGSNDSEANATAIGVGVGISNVENNPINVNRVRIDNNPTIDTTNVQGQEQGQKQGQQQKQGQKQGQEMNNGQVISPEQRTDITIENPKPFLPAPNAEVNQIPQLSYGSKLPIEIYSSDARVKSLIKGDIIVSVKLTKTTKSQGLYDTIIKGIQKLNGDGNNLNNIRMVVWYKNSVKMWSTGGQISGAGSGVLGTTGIAGIAGIFPSYGRMTADDLYIVQFVQVVGK